MGRRELLQALALAAAAGTIAPACHRSGATSAPRVDATSSRFAPLMTLRLELARPQPIGAVPHGTRTTVPIAGGAFEGGRLGGLVIPCGSEWMITRMDDVVEVEMRVLLETDAKEQIQIMMQGIHGTSERPEYVRTIARFETAAPKHAHLNRLFAVGVAHQREAVQVHSLELLL